MCVALRTSAIGDHAMIPASFVLWTSQDHRDILIEVDDLATHGNAIHAENMAKLQKTFKFGKWKSIYNSEGDYAGRTVIQDQSYGFPHPSGQVLFRKDCLLFVIPRGRRSDKKSETTDGEKRQLRAVWGSINWVQRESRPDVSALASLGMGITQSQHCAKTCVMRMWQLSD